MLTALVFSESSPSSRRRSSKVLLEGVMGTKSSSTLAGGVPCAETPMRTIKARTLGKCFPSFILHGSDLMVFRRVFENLDALLNMSFLSLGARQSPATCFYSLSSEVLRSQTVTWQSGHIPHTTCSCTHPVPEIWWVLLGFCTSAAAGTHEHPPNFRG